MGKRPTAMFRPIVVNVHSSKMNEKGRDFATRMPRFADLRFLGMPRLSRVPLFSPPLTRFGSPHLASHRLSMISTLHIRQIRISSHLLCTEENLVARVSLYASSNSHYLRICWGNVTVALYQSCRQRSGKLLNPKPKMSPLLLLPCVVFPSPNFRLLQTILKKKRSNGIISRAIFFSYLTMSDLVLLNPLNSMASPWRCSKELVLWYTPVLFAASLLVTNSRG